jgi:hypothetical protein
MWEGFRVLTRRLPWSANGAVTDFGRFDEGGIGFVWTPAVVREPGQTYMARLAEGTAAELTEPNATVNYGASTFAFSYIEGTSAEFLPSVELAIVHLTPSYSFVGVNCCEVEASQCAGAPSCHQCWEYEGEMLVDGAWDGPGIPYLKLSEKPSLDNLVYGTGTNGFQITERGAYCIEGTATASGETTHLTVCEMPTAPPMHASGIQPVFADSCQVVPDGVYPMTALVAVRGETEAQARELLKQQSAPPPASAASDDNEVFPSCEAARSAPVRSGVPPTLGVLTLLGTMARRRRWGTALH